MTIASKLTLLANTKEQIRQALKLPTSMPFSEYYKYAYPYNPASLFAAGQQGVLYDPSDLTTLWQDASGTVPVTKSGDPVGLILDKSLGLALGTELVANNNFNSDINGWTAVNSSVATVTWDNGRLKLNNVSGTSTGGQTARYVVPTVIGKTYKISARLENTGAARLRALNVNAQLAAWYAETVGTRDIQIVFTATSVNTSLELDLASSGAWGQGTIWLDNISVKELKGNHAKQTLSAARPLSQTDGTKSWLYNDKVDDKLLVTLPSMTATVVTATDDGVTINYPVSIAAGSRDISSTSTLGRDYGRIIIDKELTTDEKSQVTAYFNAKRGV